MAAKKRIRLAKEREIFHLMCHAHRKIKHSLCPRSRLFLDASAPLLAKCGFLPALQGGEEPWGICLRFQEELALGEKAWDCLERYFSSLGKLGYAQQLSQGEQCCREFEALLEEDEKRDGDATRLYLTLGAAAGAFGAILLL